MDSFIRKILSLDLMNTFETKMNIKKIDKLAIPLGTIHQPLLLNDSNLHLLIDLTDPFHSTEVEVP